MKKIILLYTSLLATAILSLQSCGGSDIKDVDIAKQYNELKDETALLYDSIASLNLRIYSTTTYQENPDQQNDNHLEYKRVQVALMNNPQIIPDTAVLGGRMYFDDIKVLNDNWVYASYNDGHIDNQVIYRYEKNKDNTYSFKLLMKLY